MKRILTLALALSVLAQVGLTHSWAQAQPAPATPPASGAATVAAPAAGRGGRGSAPALINLATAKKIVDAAEAAAAAENLKVAISVVDANGDLVYLRRMDGTPAAGVTSAPGKARAAILFGLPTKEVADAVAAGKPVSTVITASGLAAGTVTVQQGGIPVIKDGKVIAGIGVGGASSAQDEVIAKAGLEAAK
jgi:glc operon protein GlcG